MNADEESILTAYLDGELDRAHQERVEFALASDPGVAEQLRGLAVVRDLVAGLPRPAPAVDVSAAVLARLGRRRPAAGGRLIRALAPLATAAALLAAVGLGLFRPAPEPGGLVRLTGPSRSWRPPTKTYPLPDDPFAPAVATADLRPSPEEVRDDEQAERFRRLLDSPNLQTIFLVTDVVGGDADRRVGDLLARTPRVRSAFGRITVAQGIVIDPEHPGKATVYAVVMDDHELHEFPGLLTRSFPGAVKELAPRPEVVAQLAGIDAVSVLPGTPVAELRGPLPAGPARAILGPPSRDHADRSLVVPGGYDADPLHDPRRFSDVPEIQAHAGGPTPEQMRSGPHPMNRDLDRAAPRETADRATPPPPADLQPPRRLHVVLVWVTAPVG